MKQLLFTDGLDVVESDRGAITEYFISAQAEKEADPELLLLQLAVFLKDHHAQLVNLRIFASPHMHERLRSGSMLSQFGCPVSRLIQNQGPFGLSIHGHAVSGVQVQTIEFEGQAVGRMFEDGSARYLHLCLVPANTNTDNDRQIRELCDRMDAILRSRGLDFSATVRTWLFADRILTWYGELNKARDAFFSEHGIFHKRVPASTGVGIGNSNKAGIVAEALAVQPIHPHVHICKVVSPMQCEALDYKSSFSRAVQIEAPNHKRMYVSGTASIAPDGKTAHLNDTVRQIELTMQVVGALIRNGKMDWSNTVRAIAYFKDAGQFNLFDNYCKAAGTVLPHIKIEADVCRDNLWFEIELDLLSK